MILWLDYLTYRAALHESSIGQSTAAVLLIGGLIELPAVMLSSFRHID